MSDRIAGELLSQGEAANAVETTIAARLIEVSSFYVPAASAQSVPLIYLLAAALAHSPGSEWRDGIGFGGRVGHLLHQLHRILSAHGDDGDLAFGQILSHLRVISSALSAEVAITSLPSLPAVTSRTARPPRWAEYLLHLVLDRDQRIAVAGDLFEEFFCEILPRFGERAARLWYAKQAVSSIYPLLLRKLGKSLRNLAVVRSIVEFLNFLRHL